eukprot:6347401-Prymnesium_polylepis.1
MRLASVGFERGARYYVTLDQRWIRWISGAKSCSRKGRFRGNALRGRRRFDSWLRLAVKERRPPTPRRKQKARAESDPRAVHGFGCSFTSCRSQEKIRNRVFGNPPYVRRPPCGGPAR